MRKLGWLGVFVAVMALAMYAGTPVSGQQQQLPRPYGTPPPLVITAFGGKPVTYKAPRTPWGDPDLQGVWSSDDADMSLAGTRRRRRRTRRAAAWTAAPAAGCTSAQLHRPDLRPCIWTMRPSRHGRTQVAAAAKRSDTQVEGSFRFDYARRAFPQTRLLVDPPDGRMPRMLAQRGEPRHAARHLWPRPAQLVEDFSLYERCITRGIGGSVLRVIYGNGNRIVQSPGAVAFCYEMLSDTRIFYTDGRPHINQKIAHVPRRLARALGGRGAGRRNDQPHRPDRVRRQRQRHAAQQGDEDHRALPPRRRRHRSVPGDVGRSAHLRGAVHGVVPADAARWRRCCSRTTATPATRRSRCRSAPSAPKTRRSPPTSPRASSVRAERCRIAARASAERRWPGARQALRLLAADAVVAVADAAAPRIPARTR